MQKITLLLLISLFVISNYSQTPTATPAPALSGIKPNLATGEVVTINQSDNKISLKTSDGNIDVLLVSTTAFKRVPPDNPSIGAAVNSNLSEIGEGDKILVTGTVSADKKTIPAKAIYLMTKSDISKKNSAEQEMWQKRGIFGRVVSVDFSTKNITLATTVMGAERNVIISPKENVEYLRYAPGSIKFADAVEGSLADIKVGDQLRALGDRGAEGTTFKAEKYLSGTFKTIAGKVTAIDVEKGELTIEDSQTKKATTVLVNSNTVMKVFPAEQAQMMARMMMASRMMQGRPGGQGGTFTMNRPGGQGGQTGQTSPAAGNQPTGQTGQTPPAGAGNRPAGGQTQMMRAGGMEDMIERLPALTLAEIKVGDTIGISSTLTQGSSDRYTAIKLLSGVEPFLTMPQMPSVGGNAGPSLTIPGLDGGMGGGPDM